MKILSAITVAFVAIFATPVVAANVLDVSDIGTFEGQNNHGATNANIEQYSSSITTGGGQFVLGVGPLQTNCTSDHGVVLRDIDSNGQPQNCYYRQFSGPVHLSWYGVPDAASSACYNSGFPIGTCDATTALKNAFAAASTTAGPAGTGFGGDGGVTTDGRSIALLSQCAGCVTPDGLLPQAVEIPQGQYLTCATPPGVRHSWHVGNADAYWELPGSLVLDPQYTVLRDENTHLSNCFIRPSWLYPSNPILPIPPNDNVKQAVAMTHLFTGTATSCASPTCNMSNVTMAGFDICDDSSGANNAILSNVAVDCGTGEWVHAGGGGGPKLHGVIATPILEGSLASDVQEHRSQKQA